MKKIIIFNQQPADIPLVLTLLEKNHDSFITIVCIGIKNNYRFFNKILNNPRYKIIYLPKPIINSSKWSNWPKAFIKTKYYLKYIYNKYFINCSNTNIYFFAKGHDWLSMSLINRLLSNNNVFFIPAISSEITIVKPAIKEKISLLFYRWLSNTKVVYATINGKSNFIYWDNSNIKNINLLSDYNLINKYKITPSTNKNTVLLLDSNLESYNMIYDYTQTMHNILLNIKELGYSIHLKSHPRLGSTNNISKYITYQIPEYIPAEFINIKNYIMIIGISSFSLTVLAKESDNIFSILDLFHYINTEKKEAYRDFLIKNSKGRIRYINDIKQIKEIL